MLSPLQLILPGVILLVAGFLLRRGMSRVRGPQHATSGPAQALLPAEQGSAARLREFELRLHEQGREIENRIETAVTMLDGLIRQADTEIERLECLLDESRRTFAGAVGTAPGSGKQTPRLSPDQRRMICFLAMAGYRAHDIALLVKCRSEQIEELLADDSRGASAA